jgi:hypothetical protein
MRRTVPLTITFVAGVAMIMSFFVNDGTTLSEAASKVKEWGIIISAFAVVLGTGNIIRISMHKAKRGEDRPYKIVLLVCLFVTMFLGLFYGIDEKVRETWMNGGMFAGAYNPFYWIYFNIQLPLGATMFSLLVFYITSAAYRAFRMRSLEAGILLVTAVIVMLGQVPIASALGVDKVMAWIMVVPNVAAKRAIFMGAAMGIASMSLKIILGIERSYLGGES